MYLIPIPAFADNYLWLLHDGKRALIVDPGDAEPVLRTLAQYGLQLESILVTHHHADHTGGVAALRQATGAKVYGPATERIPEPFAPLQEGDTVRALGSTSRCWMCRATRRGISPFTRPTWTATHCCFAAIRFFQGAAVACLKARRRKCWHRLTNAARREHLRCTHEYTLANLRFAMAVEPDNAELAAYQAHCQQLRAQGQPRLAQLDFPGNPDQPLFAYTASQRSGRRSPFRCVNP